MTRDHDDEVTRNAPAYPFPRVLSLIFKRQPDFAETRYVSRREFEDVTTRKARQFYTRRAFAEDVHKDVRNIRARVCINFAARNRALFPRPQRNFNRNVKAARAFVQKNASADL